MEVLKAGGGGFAWGHETGGNSLTSPPPKPQAPNLWPGSVPGKVNVGCGLISKLRTEIDVDTMLMS